MLSSRYTYLIKLILMVFLSFNSFAQSTFFEKCGFDHKHNLHLQDTSYQKLIQFSEDRLSSYLTTPRTRSSNNIYTIPVVVHVLHLGESIGVGTNISDAQIQSAITNLNDVYRGQTANSPVDFEIEFALAQQDPNCTAHSGINRINASAVPNYLAGGVDYYNDGGEADEDLLKDLSRWPETEYFNIWIVSEIENNNGGSGIQGYANFFTGSAYEGSVMMATVFGFDPNNSQPTFNLNAPRDNATVVHEFGHYLHLHHTFKGDGDADNNGIGDACPGDVTVGVDSDGCSDTEPHKRYTSQCKSSSLNDCTGATFNDNSAKNYMSYSSCQDRLTNDQKNRSRAMLATSGISLIYSRGDEPPISTSGTLTSASCIPQSSSTAISGGYGGIMNFTIINEFSASSSNAQNDGGYVDFTSECLKTISLEEDSSYNFEITTWYNGHDFKGYIDFNNDGDFLDLNEEVFSGSNPPNINGANGVNTSTGNGTLTIPISNGTNILANTPLRLRIISELTSVTGNITDACYNPFYAQAEDYQLIINQSNISVQKTYIPDDNFESYLETHDENGNIVSIGSVNSMGDGIANNDSVTTSNISFVDSLNINSQSIFDLSGIEDFSSLKELHCISNQLSNLDISQNNLLFEIECQFNQLNTLDINNNTALIYLNCASNQITNLDVSSNTSLTLLECSSNLLTNLDISNNTSLTFLSCGQNQLDSLDVTQNAGLVTLICVSNSLTYLDLRNGNNINISNFQSWNNPNLYCISVDDTATKTWTYSGPIGTIDQHTICSNDCASFHSLSADFTANNVNVCLGDSISFSDASTGSPTSWSWDFGDGNSSNLQNPVHTYTNSGIFTVSLYISDGVNFDITIKNNFINVNQALTQENITACDIYNWNGAFYSQSGNYTDTLLSFLGCDSIVTLNLTINSAGNSQENISSCDNYFWAGNTYYQSGTYLDTLQSANGCDSILTLNLNIISGGSSQENISNCDNYFWRGNTYYQSGTYTDTLQSVNGCDSILTLNLTINSGGSSQENVTTCNNYIWNGNSYNQSGNYNDTLQNINGCDSIITLNLTISNYISFSENISSCNDYFWYGNNYTQSGNYTDTILVSGGCDSIVTLNLIINPSIFSTDTILSCGDYNWNGNNFSQSGNYTDTLQSTLGCDSIVSLNLTLNSSISSSETIITCDDYNWNGNNYSLSGNYVDTLSSISGCDSIVSLFLTIDYNVSNQENITTCGTYTWNGSTYSQSGTYYDSSLTSNGCDSISILNLTISPSAFGQENITTCNSFLWNGLNYSQTGNYIDTLQTSLGCDSVVTLNLIINNSIVVNDSATVCNDYFWNGNNYSNSGLFTDTLTTSLGCDSIVYLQLTILENFIFEDSVSACGSYLWNGTLIDSSGIYTDTLQSINGCDSINILYLSINNNIGAPLTLELILDDYCLETYWTVKDSQDSIWYNEGPYNCNPSGGGSQANSTIIKDIYLDESECYTFELNDYYGDGLGGALWGGSDGSWTLKDLNNIIISQGQGDFGYSINQSFYVTQSIASSISTIENKNGQIYVFPNPFKNTTSIEIKNTKGPFILEIFDISGRIIKTFYSNYNKFEINDMNTNIGIYWLRVKNKSNLKPIKLVVE